ncbi:ASCH domain-containing protein [Leifsonia sp. A12D58]|uniref:ASCH domain-containing protein n=1 Tax=Leifsonia sp. A12D58 TaxID=3397674 RepID=UPI0039E1098E
MSFPTVDGLRTMELGLAGSSRAHLNDLVINGQKRATAGLLSEYAEENEPWEQVGERLVLVDDDMNVLGTIEITRVEPTTFGEVTWEFAQAEAEGMADVAAWQEQHHEFWARTGESVADDTGVLCIYFDLLPQPESD